MAHRTQQEIDMLATTAQTPDQARKQRRGWKRQVAKDRRDEAERLRPVMRDGEPHIRPTAATETRLQPDPIACLRTRETITCRQAAAAVRIRLAWMLIVQPVEARTLNLDRAIGGGSAPEPETAIALQQAYRAWANHLIQDRRERLAAGRDAAPALQIVIDVLVTGDRTLADVDRVHGKRKGWARNIIRAGLEAFTDIHDQRERERWNTERSANPVSGGLQGRNGISAPQAPKPATAL